MNITTIITIILALFFSSLVLIKIVSSIKNDGFLCFSTFLMILVLFYTVIPMLFILFEANRDTSTAFNRLLSAADINQIGTCMLFCSLLTLLVVFFYNIRLSDGRLIYVKRKKSESIEFCDECAEINAGCYSKIGRIADVTLIIGGISVIMCIVAVGGVGHYIALGSQARGLNKSLSDYISSSFLPLITLSSIILATPYLYKLLMNAKKNSVAMKAKFIFSLVIAIIYLLFNQGRLPLLLFIVPFFLDLKIARKAKIGALLLVALACVFLLEPLSNLFTYLTYGRVVTVQRGGLLDTLLLEFTYPFTNFLNRNDLMNNFGMRWGLDYVQWPLTILPSSMLKVFGVSKSGLVTIGSLNTDAYRTLAGKVGGGIPTDFFTFNYYQFGYVSLFLSIPIIAKLLSYIDGYIVTIKQNGAARILSLRLCFLLISLVNNFDFSVIFRMRFDLFIIALVIIIIGKAGKEFK